MLLEIKKEEIDAIAEYLSGCPWRQVHGLILMIQNLKPVREAEVRDATSS
jgi:hypothetical protein